ncbi:MAG: efflux RND transporter periplasmic adaptor subunit [Candidatus Shapirobacteria bacterium]
MTLQGTIQAEVKSLAKFSISGRLAAINCRLGDQVKKGQVLAVLESIELQAYLDRALKQYDRQRAEFDEQQKQNLSEYDKRRSQDELDISVKNVEIAKCNLNATQLTASIGGLVVEMDAAAAGDNITPAGFVIILIDPTSFYFEALLPEENLNQVTLGQAAKISLKAFSGQAFDGQIEQVNPLLIKNNYFSLQIKLSVVDNLRLGLTGTAEI